ncbi:hypothetical protein HELRODRAFT_181188 [Helobdella robusta]|uniref:Uncharacterized protein n=1 Tax=Helobdella robusta TaxID=6412 RepID=T1FGQ3_HELRO|nr:hypothetical protein HELRODRAFT_181188 [Helobdella robusta]ESN93248.1 hypothetical protein HELRODRAFT_181188 [Helobdella robusta]
MTLIWGSISLEINDVSEDDFNMRSRKNHDVYYWLEALKQRKRGVTGKEIAKISRTKIWSDCTTYDLEKENARFENCVYANLTINTTCIAWLGQLSGKSCGRSEARCKVVNEELHTTANNAKK